MQSLSETTQETKHFLLSQYFADGIKVTMGVLLPSLILFRLGMEEIGMTISLGALCVSVVDNPGPQIHKRNAMLVVTPLLFIMAVLMGFSSHITWLVAIEIAVFFFFFSMFNVYGARASAVGTSALVVMILAIGRPQSGTDIIFHALYILAGGVWYMLLSLSINTIWPYRVAEQMLGESIRKVADYLRLRADFYDSTLSVEEIQKKLIKQQVEVHQHQENVREILFKTRKLLKDASPASRRIILTFVDVVDLFEKATAIHYDYDVLRKQFADTGILPSFGKIIRRFAEELDHIGRQLNNHERLTHLHDMEEELNHLKYRVDELEANGHNMMALKKILVNLRNIYLRINQIYKYTESPGEIPVQPAGTDYSQFVTRQKFDYKIFRDNLTLKSGNFRHALRVSIVCLSVYLLSGHFYSGNYSYWILLTVLVILKPGFSLTKQRNYERVIGTIIGGLLGTGVLFLVHDKTLLFVFLLAFMILSFSFIRLYYVIGVLFMTPYILIMFSFMEPAEAMAGIVQERIIDTVIGAVVAGVASYFIFPSFESHQIEKLMASAVSANATYLTKAIDMAPSDRSAVSEYRLARKEIYVSQANLGAAFQRMLDEPKQRRKNATSIHRFVILNHMFSSYVANIRELITEGAEPTEDQLRNVRKSLSLLRDTCAILDEITTPWPETKRRTVTSTDTESTLSATLDMILKTSADLKASTKYIEERHS